MTSETGRRTVAASDLADCCTPLCREPIEPAHAERMAAAFKALGDPVRLRLVSLIGTNAGGEACVCELVEAFDLSQPTISHHLRVLREAGLVECERRGSWAYYRVARDTLAALRAVLSG